MLNNSSKKFCNKIKWYDYCDVRINIFFDMHYETEQQNTIYIAGITYRDFCFSIIIYYKRFYFIFNLIFFTYFVLLSQIIWEIARITRIPANVIVFSGRATPPKKTKRPNHSLAWSVTVININLSWTINADKCDRNCASSLLLFRHICLLLPIRINEDLRERRKRKSVDEKRKKRIKRKKHEKKSAEVEYVEIFYAFSPVAVKRAIVPRKLLSLRKVFPRRFRFALS